MVPGTGHGQPGLVRNGCSRRRIARRGQVWGSGARELVRGRRGHASAIVPGEPGPGRARRLTRTRPEGGVVPCTGHGPAGLVESRTSIGGIHRFGQRPPFATITSPTDWEVTMSWKTIVVGVDGADASQHALERAAAIARDQHARLVLTSVAPVLTGMAASRGIGPYDPADPPADHRDQLEHAREHLLGRGVAAEFHLGVGDPAETIVQLADEHRAVLIVVGTREPGFVERLLHGSVSQAVARRAHCDVLIVHGP